MHRLMLAILIAGSLIVAVVAETAVTSAEAASAILFVIPILLAIPRLSLRAVVGIALLTVASYLVASAMSDASLNVRAWNAAGLLMVGAISPQLSRHQSRLTNSHARILLRERALAEREQRLKVEEARLYGALVHSPVTFFEQDRSLRYTWMLNPPSYLKETAIIGKTDHDIFQPEEANRLTQIKRSVIASGISSRFEIQVTIGDQAVSYDLTIEPLRAQDDGVIGVTSAAIDISQWKHLEQHVHMLEERERAAQSAQAEAEAHQRRIGRLYQRMHQFISSIAHELSQPFTAILGSAQTLERLTRNRFTDSDRRMIRIIVDAARRGQRLITDLRTSSTIESGHFSVHPAPMDLVEAVHQVFSEQSDVDKERLILETENGIEGVWDRDRIIQLVTNLTSNALKYSPEGSEVRIDVRQDGDRVLISVADRGPGISLEDQAKLFEPFSRLSEESRIDGTGLGLYVTRQIVEAHDGQIWIESEPGHGSTFCVALPTANATNAAENTPKV